MRFVFDWVIQNPIQTVDKGITITSQATADMGFQIFFVLCAVVCAWVYLSKHHNTIVKVLKKAPEDLGVLKMKIENEIANAEKPSGISEKETEQIEEQEATEYTDTKNTSSSVLPVPPAEPKVDKRKTPEFKARLLENLRKGRETRKKNLEIKKKEDTNGH